MEMQHFTTILLVAQTPQEVFDAVNHVRGWWSENITGPTDQLNGEFIYQYKDIHRARIKVTELLPGQKVVWQVVDNYFRFTEDKSEWIGTTIVFEISPKDGKTFLQFTHVGLVPQYECFQVCNEAWTHFIRESLYPLITTGKGVPTPKDETEESFAAELTDRWQLER